MASTENQDSAGMAQGQPQPQIQQHQHHLQQTAASQQPSHSVAQAQHQSAVQQQQTQQQQQATQQAKSPNAQVQSPQLQQQQQNVTSAPASAQQAAAVAAAASAVPVGQSQDGNANQQSELACQWSGCREICQTPEALYEHVCERHVGRKSTNNLNLSCGWANCRTTTVKRDHITSHIRVHVPLKPHKCDFCGKAFKRPQDLKKHVKTHADDSVLVRSPEPGQARPPNGMYGVAVGANGRPGHYFDGSMAAVPGAPYGHGAPQYYHPQHHPQHHAQHPQHSSNPSYGNVYYAVGSDATHQASYESKKRGYDALNDFFGDLKRRQFDPTSYAAVGQRLLNLHGLPLPLVHTAPVAEYQPMPAMVAVGGHGGYHAGPMPPQSYHLPPMGNLRTKADLMNIDQYLEQMQSTVYESDENVAAAGVAQPGAHFVHGALSYRATNSPPAATHLPSSHATATTSAPHMTSSMSARSPQSVTPALTPPSSAQSYTSGRSPISLASNHDMSPSHLPLPHTTSSMYPTLPSTSTHETVVSTGYPTVSGSAAPSTLSTMFDPEDRRRYTGGMLQKARVERSVEPMDMSVDGGSPKSTNAEGEKINDNMIDPFLRRASADKLSDRETTPTARRPAGSRSPASFDSSRKSSGPITAEEIFVENVRLLTQIRKYVRERLSQGDYEDENGLTRTEMEGMEAIAAAAAADREDERTEDRSEENNETSETRTENLYPVLRMDIEEDKMDES